jgi:AraC-like DNA-binding protein
VNATGTVDGEQEPFAKRLSGLVAERQRETYPSGVLVALRSVQRVAVSAGRFGPSWSQRLILAKWVLRGEAAMEVDGRRLRFGPGQVAIYLPTIPHRFWALESSNRFCWFSIDGPFAEPFVMELGLRSGVYDAPAPKPQTITAMASSLADRSIAGRRTGSLLAIAEWYRLAQAIGTPPVPSLANAVRAIIAEEFADPELSAAGIAKRLGCHRGTLSRVFHRETGQTLVDYLAQIRLQEAQSLLRQSDDGLADIARQCGIRDAAYFCRWFRKRTGRTPAAHRRQPPAVR